MKKYKVILELGTEADTAEGPLAERVIEYLAEG